MSNDFDVSSLRAQHLYDGLEASPCGGEQLQVPGPGGVLEVLTACPPGCVDDAPVAVLCHPHPLYGGSMVNKVVHILADTFNDLGAPTVRFNFRGVGASAGRYDKGVGETDDLLAILAWVRARHPHSRLWLAGFSFGAYVAMRAMARVDDIDALLLIAPPVSLFDFAALPGIDVPWMVIQGGKDEVISPQDVSTWAQAQNPAPRFLWMAEADHFFHGRLNRLRAVLRQDWPRVVDRGRTVREAGGQEEKV